MPALLVPLFTWFASYLVASFFIKLFSFILFFSVSSVLIYWVFDQIFALMDGFVMSDLLYLAGVGTALSIIAGAILTKWAYKSILMFNISS